MDRAAYRRIVSAAAAAGRQISIVATSAPRLVPGLAICGGGAQQVADAIEDFEPCGLSGFITRAVHVDYPLHRVRAGLFAVLVKKELGSTPDVDFCDHGAIYRGVPAAASA